MASMKLSLAFVLLLAGAVALGSVERAGAVCEVVCFQGGYITCDNYPNQELDGCHCECAPKDGKNCVLHLDNGSTSKCN